MKTTARIFIFATLFIFSGVLSALAMPPHPDLVQSTAAGKQAPSYYIEHRDELQAKGVCIPDESLKRALAAARSQAKASLSPSAGTPFRILAILVQFSDHASQVSATFFDSLVFSTSGNTVRDYFDEVSYAQIDIVTVNMPSSLGWRTAPQTYAYYVNNAQGLGSYPNNSQKLVEDLVDQINPLVDYTQYDNDSDGYVDVVMVIHSGRGAEFTGANTDIWSHKWGITPRLLDGVRVFNYTMQPEYWSNPGDMTIGVYAHELAHGFGLPDLYDTDNSSNGIGRWCLMSYGSWNGPSNRGGSPSHPSAWCRIDMGFATSTNVTTPLSNQQITNVEAGGTIYRMWTGGLITTNYFLVENRQHVGYDAYLPSTGLLIWHIDDLKNAGGTPNSQEWWPGQTAANHYGVALEQADGLYELEHKVDAGDGGDPFPGNTNNTTFSDSSTPAATTYAGATTNVQVSSIATIGQIIQANLIVTLASGTEDDPPSVLPVTATLDQNYPNPFNPSTVIKFELIVSQDVTVDIYNLTGQKVRRLYSDRAPIGETTLTWDATTDDGQPVASGIYLYRFTSDYEQMTRKMVLMR
ncbi:MAG: M6 family metalloprotease domain-containing protein [bacterium]|nr:M6 family metalloprotease domain-containing protein [bacterium]